MAADTAGAPPFEAPSIEDLAPLFPRLTIVELLGKGGMGAVYKARQNDLDRLVALKIVPRGDAGQAAAERFAREARALARLSHPNIVGIHEFGTAGDFHFFIMEFVDGLNLRALNKAGRLSPREALQIVPQICDALQYAHDQGVVHRDIKPENVLIDRHGRVKIADFGIAKLTETVPAQHLTAEGQTMGTPHYMAPEQIEHPRNVDHRADIFSLGVVFYELLTGELPLGKFPAPSRRVQVDVRLDEVVLRALEKEPALRYQQAGEIKTAVETIAQANSLQSLASNSAREIATAGFYGKIALALFAAGTLGTLVLSAVSHRDEYALAFGALALLGALLFGIAGRQQRLGKVIAVATIVILAGCLLTIGILSEVIPIPGRAAKAEQARAQAETAAEVQRLAIEEQRKRKATSPAAGLQFRWVATDVEGGAEPLPNRILAGGSERSAVLREVLMDGTAVARAGWREAAQRGQREVQVELKAQAARKFEKLTKENTGRQLAIVWNGEVLSTPIIRTAISAGQLAISGAFTKSEMHTLIDALNGRKTASTNLTLTKPLETKLWADGLTNTIWIDLDTGKRDTNGVHDIESIATMTARQMDVATNPQWVHETPARGFDIVLVPLNVESWETVAAADVVNSWSLLKTGAPKSIEIRPRSGSVYMFRTRENGLGVLRITAIDTEGRDPVLEYKLAQAP